VQPSVTVTESIIVPQAELVVVTVYVVVIGGCAYVFDESGLVTEAAGIHATVYDFKKEDDDESVNFTYIFELSPSSIFVGEAYAFIVHPVLSALWLLRGPLPHI